MSLCQSTRESTFDDKGGECLFCGTTRAEHEEIHGRDLDIHHLIPKRAGGCDEVDNLIPVCIPCHKRLERTQADALARMVENEAGEQELKEEIAELRSDIEELERQLSAEREKTQRVLYGVEDLLDCRVHVSVYAVHESKLNTSELRYVGTDYERAKEAFESCDGSVTMETANVTVSEWVSNLSSGDLNRLLSGSDKLADELEKLIND